jgi:hypothetical protein
VGDAKGAIAHAAGYAQKQYSAGIPWSTTATARPLEDLRNVQLQSRGQSVDFGGGSIVYVNRVQGNYLLSNTNDADLGGKFNADNRGRVTSIQAMNVILTMEGIPNVQIYDDGYFDETGTWRQWIPDGVGIVVGRRTNGAQVGEFRYTWNVNNPGGAPAAYTRVIDRSTLEIPAEVEVHDGFNGGPVIYYPGSIVKMNI